ncbi:hypothetical protein BABINDRAFT_33713, partial [Babjeviella inositovora NRRL Y-12698]
LDVTGFHSFHHDGPFDACTPHRNKKAGKLAPVNAFPVDGPNSSIKGMGFANASNEAEAKSQTMDRMFGQTNFAEDGPLQRAPIGQSNESVDTLQQYNALKKQYNSQITSFDSTLKAEPIHGDTTYGLGSLTFLEGAPAPRKTQFEEPSFHEGGLGRKKSLSQRLRKNSSSGEAAQRNSGAESDNVIEGAGSSLLRRVKSLKVSRR